MISAIMKLRTANGTAFVSLPKKIMAEIPGDTKYFLVFLDDEEIVLRPLNYPEGRDGG
jgi:hypothetical protein